MAEEPKQEPKQENKPDMASQIDALVKRNAELDEKLNKLLADKTPKDEDIFEKAKNSKNEKDKKATDEKALDQAIRFDLQHKEWLKTNAALLPKEVESIFETAAKETYSNAIEKDQAIKSGLIQSFFAVQANADLLTPAQKTSLDEYLKLTKTGKQDRAQPFYDSVFEPTFENLKKIKKAEALSKGHAFSDSDSDSVYKKNLIDGSRKHYFRETK